MKRRGLFLFTQRGCLRLAVCVALATTPGRASGAIGPGALQQIGELLQEKKNRTPAQQKIDSQLLYAIKAQRGERITPSIASLACRPKAGPDGSVVVDVTGDFHGPLLGRLSAAGATVIHASGEFGMARLKVPLAQVENLAAMPEVRFVQPAAEGATFAAPAQDDAEGLIAHGVDFISRNASNFADLAYINNSPRLRKENKQIRIGVISDSLDTASQDMSTVTGTAPWMSGNGPIALPGESGTGTDEGLAMLEVIEAIAPGCELYFATGQGGPANMADNIVQLSNTCQIIVDDYQYAAESPFQDGPIALAVDHVVKQHGIFYFSASGDLGNLYSGNSGTWEGQFLSSGTAPIPPGYSEPYPKQYVVHKFGALQDYDVLTRAGKGLDLFWSDPLGHSRNDYDLFLLSADGSTVEGASTNIQTGDQDPYEHIDLSGSNAATLTGSDQIVIVKSKYAQTRCLHLSTEGGQLLIATAGGMQGHCASRSAFCVGAASAYLPAQASRPFIFSDGIEPYSSDGFRRYFFDPDGRLYTPEDYGQAGGIVVTKPDFVAADGVTTTLSGTDYDGRSLNPFYGSSAAASQAAGIGALLLAIDPKITWREMRRVLLHSCVDIMQYGVDRNSGFGALRADLAVQNLKLIDRSFDSLSTMAPPADQLRPLKQ